MAKLCEPCKAKPQPAGIYHGQCQAKIASACNAWTHDFTFTLCDPCADQLNRCAWCWGPLDGSWGRCDVPTTKQFCRQYWQDNGKHVEGMDVGEQILVQLPVDLYTYLTWKPRIMSPQVSYYGFRLVREPGNWREATLEMYFDLNRPAEKAEIVVEEAP